MMNYEIRKRAEHVASLVNEMKALAQAGNRKEAERLQLQALEIRTAAKINWGADLKEFDALCKEISAKL